MPASYQITDPMLLEMKTSGTGRKFTELVEKDVKEAKPIHYAQMSTYGWKYGFKYALYLCINKNDDDIHVEIVELDWRLGEECQRKAEDVIFSKFPPPRINESPAYHLCKQCDRFDVCHKGANYEVNCRSCDFAEPIDNGEWRCNKWNAVIPLDAIPKACPSWHPVGRQ